MFFFSPLYILLVGPALLLGLWASFRVKSAFARFSKVAASSGLSGAQAAAQMLQSSGLRVVASSADALRQDGAVAIESVDGFLSDHYDPRARVLRLSPAVYGGRSLASVGVACHEAGHALQHARGYAPLALRAYMVPVASFGSWAAIPIIFLGAFLGSFGLINLGVVLFSAIVFFQLVTLPVEFDASRRAKEALVQIGVVRSGEESQGVAAVLNAAAWTYVAAAVSSIATLAYYLLVFTGNSRD